MKVDSCQIYCFIVLFDSVFVVVKKTILVNIFVWGALSIYIQFAGNPSHFWTVNRQNQQWLANGPQVSRELNSPWTKPYKAPNIRKNFWNWGLLYLCSRTFCSVLFPLMSIPAMGTLVFMKDWSSKLAPCGSVVSNMPKNWPRKWEPLHLWPGPTVALRASGAAQLWLFWLMISLSFHRAFKCF